MSVFHKMRGDRLAAMSLTVILLTAFAGIFAPWLAPHSPEQVDMELRYASPSWQYLLGNDHLGRCVLSRLIYGIRPSVLWVFVALAVSALFGAMLGLLAGYFRGKTDNAVMRICDVMLSFPGYVMSLAVVGILGPGIQNILIAFVIMKWAWFARVIRTSVMQYADADYVRFAKATGMSNLTIMIKHIVPVALPDFAVISSSAFGTMILQISGLSFLGLGIEAPHAEWGMMLNEARGVMFSRPELMLAPGLAIVIVVSAVNFCSDALQAALDPKLQRKLSKPRRAVRGLSAKLKGEEVV
ncbi:peptide ABC transporter permease [Paenibacillus sp. FSL R7-0273]|uniref:staphylopine uptake ABC transporter permease subunit CntC n=1 Tax=Paenibacillus sp. FSL R7-0273 TaxID=1536772 RepID=UPI0004F82EE4|nr:nickel/cobalt ABC transporter permease [Paenibacillus sp. FSL R7-0273]AIQ47371.1 peptide ABC transporter permease [Paenibacillus sp. FSL R7-0273]OMF96075.1 peptide ABC transporter permease [Paenibacillus sp. FSL R7-0273]